MEKSEIKGFIAKRVAKELKDGDTVNLEVLLAKKIIRKPYDGLKVLGDGELTKKLTVQAARFTGAAKEKITAVGGQAEEV